MAASRDADMNNSSPTSSFDAEDEADLFPDSTTATSNPLVQNDHLNAAAPGELSPPRSQGSEEPEAAPIGMLNEDTNGHPSMDYREEKMAGTNGDSRGQDPAKPGSGWNNKRAQEEFQRAWDTVLDKDFSLREFGDVMALEEEEQQQQPRRQS
jgi:hypothetical protein